MPSGPAIACSPRNVATQTTPIIRNFAENPIVPLHSVLPRRRRGNHGQKHRDDYHYKPTNHPREALSAGSTPRETC
jgi:hypothetical protein